MPESFLHALSVAPATHHYARAYWVTQKAKNISKINILVMTVFAAIHKHKKRMKCSIQFFNS